MGGNTVLKEVEYMYTFTSGEVIGLSTVLRRIILLIGVPREGVVGGSELLIRHNDLKRGAGEGCISSIDSILSIRHKNILLVRRGDEKGG